MASRRIEERRAEHKRYKEDVERTGKPFFPYAMFHDTVMSLVVVCVIIGLACVWYFTADGSTDPGWLGPYYTEEADPGTTNFVPRPDWYFYFLFYLLRIFKWPDTVVLGTVGIPNILLGILIALPFIDLRRERRLSRRPVAIVAAIVVVLAMGTLTYKGATAKESLGSETIQEVPKWAEEQGFADNEEAVAGAELFAVAGCLQCHTYLGSGSSNLGAPDLSDIGATGKGVAYFQRYVDEPGAVRKHGRCRRSPPSARRTCTRSRSSSTPPRARRTSQLNVFLGVTGASGAPYAARLLRALDGVGLRGWARCVGCGHRGARDGALRRREPPAGRRARALHRGRRRRHRLTASTTTRARTRPARRRSTRTSSVPARCRRSERSQRARWRT